jgi:hypothetical protein
MKTLFTIAATLITSLLIQAQHLEKIHLIPIKGSYTNPLPSPDGNFALLTKSHFKGVYLLDLKTKKIKEITKGEGSGFAYSWNNTNTTFYYKEKGPNEYFLNSKIKGYNLITAKKQLHNGLNPNYLPAFKGFNPQKENNIIVYTNTTTLKIEAKDLVTQKSWIITNEDGQFYNALISNNGKQIAVHNGADIYLYAIDGKSKGQKVGKGIATSWSSDDNYLIGFIDESKDGHSITNSDLFLYDVINFKTIQLTFTTDAFEMYPCFYGKNNIMFSEDKTGKIYVSELKL